MTENLSQELDIQQLVKHKQLTLLYAAVPSSLLASLFGAATALHMFQDVIDPVRLYIWVLLILVVSIIRYHHFISFKNTLPEPDQIAPWFLKFRISTLLSAFSVGSGGLLLFAYESSDYQMLLALMIVCMGSFAATTLSPHKPIVITFLIITFFPLVIIVYFLHTEVTEYISWFLILLTIMLIISSLRIYKTITESITLSIEAQYREERIRDYEQRLRMFMQETPLAAIEWNANLNVIAWNPASESMFGYQSEQIQNLDTKSLMYNHSDNTLRTNLEFVLENGHGHQSILENRGAGGSLILCEWINTPLIDAQENVIGVMSMVQNISERIANEKLKKEFISIVSHELRTPVTSIKGSLGLLQSGVLDQDEAQRKEMLDIALNNTNRLHLLINDILDVDKLDSGKVDFNFANHDLCELIKNVIASISGYAQQYSVELQVKTQPESCILNIDQNRLFQVLTNLLSNAIKFSTENNIVTIALEKVENVWRVSITNFGEVIPESDREHMFSKFYQRDSSTTREKGGTGLGLYICQKILKQHNSMLNFVSSRASGTTFYFDLESDNT